MPLPCQSVTAKYSLTPHTTEYGQQFQRTYRDAHNAVIRRLPSTEMPVFYTNAYRYPTDMDRYPTTGMHSYGIPSERGILLVNVASTVVREKRHHHASAPHPVIISNHDRR